MSDRVIRGLIVNGVNLHIVFVYFVEVVRRHFSRDLESFNAIFSHHNNIITISTVHFAYYNTLLLYYELDYNARIK